MDVIEDKEYEDQLRKLKMSEIDREKHELFHDFITLLLKTVEDTYLGKEYLVDDTDIRRHFKWCWDLTVKTFEKERIFFICRSEINMYFYVLLLNTFYKINENDGTVKILKTHMDFLFSDKDKSKIEFDFYYDTYMELKDMLKNYGRVR